MKIFVLHYSKLTNRKIHMIDQLKKQNITDYEFIEKFDKDELTIHDRILFDVNYKKSTMSLHLKHNYAYKIIAEKYEHALIFEDDVILCDNFSELLRKYMAQLPANYDMLFIGDGCNLHIEKHKLISNKNVYEKSLYPTSWGGGGATRCCDSYVVSNKCANQLCEYIKHLPSRISLPIDWWLNITAKDNNFKIYWAEPTIVTQGSQTGMFKTSH
jgi:glycosyl transferase family 25